MKHAQDQVKDTTLISLYQESKGRLISTLTGMDEVRILSSTQPALEDALKKTRFRPDTV